MAVNENQLDGRRPSSLLDKFNDMVRYSTLESPEDTAPYVEETEDNTPNPFEQKATILILIFMYSIQSFSLQIPSVLSVYMSHEVSQCPDRYYIQKYLDNVFWPFSFKILFAPIVDLIPLCCFKKKYHRRAYIFVTGAITASIYFLLAFNWSAVDPDASCPNGLLLFVHLFGVVLFTAIGDVALDGLAILALQGKNIGYFALISNIGDSFGKNGGGTAFLFLEKKIGVRTCYVIVGSSILLSLFCIGFMKEHVRETTGANTLDSHKAPTTLLMAYKHLYRVVCNKNALFFGITGMAFYRIWRSAFFSPVDVTNIGYTKNEVALVGIIEFAPTLLSIYLITQFISARVNSIKKLKFLYPLMIIGCALFVATVVIPPYMNGTTSGDSKETWVFPFRTIVNIIATPMKNIVGLLIIGHASTVTPINCPGTFMTFMLTLNNFGPKIIVSVRNYIRNSLTDLAKENGYGICDGSKDNLYQGKLTQCINTTLYTRTKKTEFVSCGTRNSTLIRFCGKEVCRPDQYCNKWGDGYVLFSVIALIFGVIYYILFWFVIANKIDKKKIDYDPNNMDERLSCCPVYCCGENMYDEDDEDFYHTLPDAADDDDQRKNSYIELA